MKKILCLSLITCSIFSMQLDVVSFEKKENILQKKLFKQDVFKLDDTNKMRIKPTSVFVPQQLGLIDLHHGKKGFHVVQDNQKYVIKKYDTDPIIRNITHEQLKAFLKSGYLAINRMNNGEFTLKAKGRINGGGVLGALIGAAIGKVAVSVVGHGTILLVGGLTGPAAPYTIFALESYFGAAIEVASIKGAVTCGLIGAVATGPV